MVEKKQAVTAAAKSSNTEAKASTAKSATAKATAAKTATAKPAAAKTTAPKAAATKSATSKTTAAKATAVKSTAAKKTAAKTTATKPATAKAATTKSATAKAATAKSATAKAATAKSATAKTTVTKATAAKPAAEKKAASKATAAKTTTTKAVVTKASTAKVKDAKAAEKSAAPKPAPASAAKQAEAPASKSEPQVEQAPVAEVSATPEPAPAPEPEPAPEPASAPEPKPEPESTPEPEPEPEPKPEPAPEFADVPGVLIAAVECAPLTKIGGLADVVGALPKYLKSLGVDARVIMPFHRQIKELYYGQVEHLCDFQASLGWRSQYVGLEKLELDGVIYYFIDNEFYFGGPVYCGGEFEGEQYAFFTRAVVDAIPQLDFDVRILHCNDWHTAMMPLLAKTQYHGGMQENLRTVLTIHNLHFQGQFSHEFDRDLLRVDDSLATPEFIEHYGCDNMLKAGIVFADKVTTVSPTYASEICSPYQGESLDGVLRSRGGDLSGILNGIDVDVWNPQTDANLPARYSIEDMAGKREVRDALLYELGLAPAGENTAVISMVGRLTPQKGVDLVRFILDELMQEDVRVIVLGSGYKEYEDYLRDAENRYKGRLCSYIGYNADLSHRIYAGSDLFLMPSLFEPCGISQMIAMRYGTLPIVRETGGLKDTVVPYNEFTGEGNGFSFANYDAGEMLGVIRYALSVWRNEDARTRLVKQAMQSDFSFERCARAYAELYRSLL